MSKLIQLLKEKSQILRDIKFAEETRNYNEASIKTALLEYYDQEVTWEKNNIRIKNIKKED